MGKLIQLEKRKFVLSVGDEGAILTCMNGKKLEKRLFATSPESSEFTELLESIPKAPVYILVDVVDQAYIQHSLPPVSSLNIGKLVQKKLSKDFEEDDIKSAIQVGREKTGRKDWNYLFISVRNSPPFSEWVEAVGELPNRLAGIYLLPIESESYLKDLKSLAAMPETPGKEAEWQIIVSHHRVGGFRQIVYRNNKIVFTRIAQPIGGFAPDVIAGNIEQETLNTVEYIRRLGFADEAGLDVFIICSQDVKAALESNALTASSITVFTPYEVASGLNFEGVAEETDRFGDIVLAASFITAKKHVLKLHTPASRKMEQLFLATMAQRALAAVGVVGIIAYSITTVLSTNALEEEMNKSLAQKEIAAKRLSEVKKSTEDLGGNSQKIKEIVTTEIALIKDVVFPLEFISQFASLRGFNMHVKTLEINVSQNDNAHDMVDARFRVDFFATKGMTQDRMLEDIELFVSDTKRKFRKYDIKFSDLPGSDGVKLDIGTRAAEELKNISINLNIKGPRGEKA